MQVDFLPKSFWLRINNKTYKIKNNHINKFFDITQFIEERDSDKLVIHVDLDRNLKQEDYFYGIYIVKKLDPEQIYQDVIKRVGKFKTTRKIRKLPCLLTLLLFTIDITFQWKGSLMLKRVTKYSSCQK